MSDNTAFYVRFHGNNLQLADLQQQAAAEADSQFASEQALQQIDYMIFDEFDRAHDDAMYDFLHEQLAYFDGQIIIISRNVPISIIETDLRESAQFYPIDESMLLNDYAAIKPNRELLEVRAFGRGRVMLNGREITDWDGVLPRTLFFYFVDRGMVTRDDIFNTFWPNMSVREATNVFHVTKRKISEVLGIDLTVYSSGFYCISPNVNLCYDVLQFTQMMQDANIAEPESTLLLLKQALKLQRSHFLSDLNDNWVINRRNELIQSVEEALTTMAEVSESFDQIDEALGYYLRASATNTQREDIVQKIMQIYMDREQTCDALKAYNRLRDALTDAIGVLPRTELTQLAEQARLQCSDDA